MDGFGFILGSLRVPDHHISICPRDDPAFPGVKVVDLGCIWACDGNKAILIHFTSNLWIITSMNSTMFLIFVMKSKATLEKIRLNLLKATIGVLHNHQARLRKFSFSPNGNKRTTPFSQMTLIRSWMPGSPWGIFVKSSLPIAFCLMVNGRWSDATTFRVSLQ